MYTFSTLPVHIHFPSDVKTVNHSSAFLKITVPCFVPLMVKVVKFFVRINFKKIKRYIDYVREPEPSKIRLMFLILTKTFITSH